MRLLQRGVDGRLRLTEDLVGDSIPRYAILSHTWGPDAEEVTFTDFEGGECTATSKKGFRKLELCMAKAELNDIQHCWVDTCCIDKSKADELQASINSMFRWYRDAAQCFVYLSDVSADAGLSPSWKEVFEKSRWFTRGWTLQELLAPASMQFFSCEGELLGDKESLEPEIHRITQIPIQALRKGPPFDQFDVDERLRWAEKRQTTREEDWAYCLLGIFGVFMSLLYGEGKENATRRLTKEIDNTPKRQGWLRKFYVCPYRDRKDRNPQRVEGTCEWFTSHRLFREWQQSNTASLLWVSADPGCGKSVLSKYLADEVLRSTTTRTTCYFFFKDDFEDQKSSIPALCSMLHQNFDQHPASFSTHILETFETKGDTLLKSFSDLWDALISATTSNKRETVYILDALDECETSERNQLIDNISKFCSRATSRALKVKFLLTSRPYADIKQRFRDQECVLPTIHLKGEEEEEIGKISLEIDSVIKGRVVEVSRSLDLGPEEQAILTKELTQVPHRTYLWVHLVFDEIRKSTLLTRGNIQSQVHSLPRTVSEAYNRILSKSPDRDVYLAKKLLHIIVAAVRPLTLKEMATALAIGPDHRSIGDLDLVPEGKFRDHIRQLCGLFVVVVDYKVYLIHQTAREFLIPPLSPGPSLPPSNQVLRWQFSLHPEESHRILAEICIQGIALLDLDLKRIRHRRDRDEHIAMHSFLEYAAQNWPGHFREAKWVKDWALDKAVFYCRPGPPVPVWFEICQRLSTREMPSDYTPLFVVCYFGLARIMSRLPKRDLTGVKAKDSKHGRTAISWAAGEGYDAVLKRLLRGGAVRRFFGVGSHMNAKDRDGRTPLHRAAWDGHDTVVRLLLEAGADVGAKDKDSETPLHQAASDGRDTVVRLLLEAGADVGAKDTYSLTPLHQAAWSGHDTVVRLLLEAGADVGAKDKDSLTPLHRAAWDGHDTVVRLLLEAGADVGAKGWLSQTPLHQAASRGHDTVVRLLLEAGASS